MRVYKLTPGLLELIKNKHPRLMQYTNDDLEVYRSLVAETRVKSFLNRTADDRALAMWKWKQLLKKMVTPGERIVEESRDNDDTDGVEFDTASVGDPEPSHRRMKRSLPPPPVHTRRTLEDVPPSPAHTRSYGKAKMMKERKLVPIIT